MEDVRLTLLTFLQDRKVKLSVFLQLDMQHNNAVLVLPMDGPAPPLTVSPGAIRHYDATGISAGRIPDLL